MVVSAQQVIGTIGGGHLEWQAIGLARDALARGALARERMGQPPTSLPEVRHFALGPSLGQCCGGALDLRFEPFTQEALSQWPSGQPWFHLQLYGAGHVGRALVQALAPLPCEVQWIDEREHEFPPEPWPMPRARAHITRLCVEPVEAEVAAAPVGTCFLVMTHQHDLDMRITEAVLRRADFVWLGLIGSATKRARFEHRFRERGIAPALLERLVCPIGLPGIHGKEPEVIAAAVVAQLLQLRSARPSPTLAAEGP